ncbi:unnamed protein product [Sphenostylis stenocarpa]|uniref:Uncharacterized protein n=1 Tax=Sphenostylis stenocarpa TaxID=92480 RepID=A0AA86RUG0_9FABA|nr:unnamed protein product [Sphenostylis stenocarpa]
MDNHKEEEAIAELSRAIAFKADLHLLHLRAAFHEHKEDVLGALRDCRAALSVDPNHQEMGHECIKTMAIISSLSPLGWEHAQKVRKRNRNGGFKGAERKDHQ